MLLLSHLPMSDYNEGISYHVLFVLDDEQILLGRLHTFFENQDNVADLK